MEGEEVRCTGFFATGGAGFLEIEFIKVALLGRLESWFAEVVTTESFLVALMRLLLLVGNVLGSYRGGSLRSVTLGALLSDVDMDEAVDWKDSVLDGLETVTQSGSSVIVKGFEGRVAFGTAPLWGGCTEDLAGRLLSNHHFL